MAVRCVSCFSTAHPYCISRNWNAGPSENMEISPQQNELSNKSAGGLLNKKKRISSGVPIWLAWLPPSFNRGSSNQQELSNNSGALLNKKRRSVVPSTRVCIKTLLCTWIWTRTTWKFHPNMTSLALHDELSNKSGGLFYKKKRRSGVPNWHG